MMLKYFTAFCITISMGAMTQAQQQKIEFKAPGVYPEGIAYDATANVFYVSGVRYGTVGKVDMMGKYTELFRDSSLKSTYGMKLDPQGKKLWICAGDANYSLYASPATHKKMIRLVSIDLLTWKKLNDIDLSNLVAGKHFANDLCFDNNGNIYITDSFSPNIYKIDAAGNASVFASSPLFWSANIGLNGIAWHPGGYLLAVNSGAGCILKIAVSNPAEINKVKIDRFFPGGDGLLLDNKTTLTIAQNQSVNKIFKLVSNDDWKTASVEMFTKADALFQQPSTLTAKGKETWVMNSKLNELADSMHLPAQSFSIQQAQFFSAK